MVNWFERHPGKDSQYLTAGNLPGVMKGFRTDKYVECVVVKHWMGAIPWLLLLVGGSALLGQDEGVRQEEAQEYFKRWLDEDVRYIIAEEEKDIFEELTTEEEKELFIEQFWYRRDPDPRTAENEYKEEHYRRIAYTNERFQSGMAGWKTDRGRIYITHGPPAEITSYPSGGRYLRESHEGGGSTSTFPFEVWRYRNIPGMDGEVLLEFVDKSWAGQYRLTMNPDEKDALMMAPGAGLTLAEELGHAKKVERPYFQPGMRDRYPLRRQRTIDDPFIRYERFVQVQMAEPIKYDDLKQIVEVDVSFNELTFDVRQDYLGLNEDQVFVPVTLEIENKYLSFQEAGGANRAKLAVYGIVTSIRNRIITEFDEDLELAFNSDQMSAVLKSRSSYQRILLLDRGMRYRLDLVIKDLNSNHVGVVRVGLAPPKYQEEQLESSSLILSELIVPLPNVPEQQEMFVLGDIKVRPSVNNVFSVGNPLGLYLQILGLGMDQGTLAPSVETRYRISRDGDTVVELTGGDQEGIRVYSDDRAALIKVLPTADLEPGKYRVEVEVKDLVKGQSVRQVQDFRLVASLTI
ncbi:MAG TPA: GWxTD domain-containing protein [Acidobacteriota bacterium]|nr:GWxTD domain-containing protein [Acidobacteriota bacterium]